MGCPLPIIRPLSSGYGIQMHLTIHVFMDGRLTAMDSLVIRIYLHHPISGSPIMVMVDFTDCLLDLLFLLTILLFPVLQVIVVCIRINIKFPKQPPEAELLMVFLNESISL